ncbi:YidC family membrane integrase SpoIIIJ [Bacillus thermotolerans]|uniref:YidC family membrane integrase SpoIIIJ n=1 Tax=Bacillus thermotolerans TaxID=1221996 RepID=UPI00057C8307|nr:YidC family membrane integrase SpoIIIJ [Bacillus thermotolerans]KKB37472.1 Inner membrane protein translocase component YidC [Bacillus thermotolerans]
MSKKTITLILLMVTSVLLAGCTEFDQEITAESEGFWNEFIVYPLSFFIIKTAELVGGYGWAIIIVTVIIRLVILPLMVKQTKNSRAMQKLQPEMQKLKEKYKSKDAVTQQKLQQETMQLFQQYNVNPLAGCFPLLIQMPIIFGIYQAIMRTDAIKQDTFLWFDLGSPDPIFLLPLIAGVTTFLQQKIMMAGMAGQNPQMAMMLWLMPVMIVVFAINLPAALSLYWVVGNVFMIVQTLVINKISDREQAASVSK